MPEDALCSSSLRARFTSSVVYHSLVRWVIIPRAIHEGAMWHLLVTLGWNLSVRSLSRVHGKYLTGHGRFLRSDRRGSHLWFVLERLSVLKAEREISFRIQSISERCEIDAGQTSS